MFCSLLYASFCCVLLLQRWPKQTTKRNVACTGWLVEQLVTPPPSLASLTHAALLPPATCEQGPQGNRATKDSSRTKESSRTTGWGWPSGGSGAGPVDPGDYDTVEANASMAMLPAIPCR